MPRTKKTKEPETPESIGIPVDLSSYSEPSPTESETDELNITINPEMRDGPNPLGEKKKRGRKPGTKNKTSEGDPLIDGETLVMFIDIIMPLAIAATNNMVSKDKISPDDLLLTEKMKDKMKVFADRCAESINLSMNPWAGLFLLSAGAYGYKVMELKNKV